MVADDIPPELLSEAGRASAVKDILDDTDKALERLTESSEAIQQRFVTALEIRNTQIRNENNFFRTVVTVLAIVVALQTVAIAGFAWYYVASHRTDVKQRAQIIANQNGVAKNQEGIDSLVAFVAQTKAQQGQPNPVATQIETQLSTLEAEVCEIQMRVAPCTP